MSVAVLAFETQSIWAHTVDGALDRILNVLVGDAVCVAIGQLEGVDWCLACCGGDAAEAPNGESPGRDRAEDGVRGLPLRDPVEPVAVLLVQEVDGHSVGSVEVAVVVGKESVAHAEGYRFDLDGHSALRFPTRGLAVFAAPEVEEHRTDEEHCDGNVLV